MILGQLYIVKMAIFDQIYQHRKELTYRDFKDLFGNGMAWGTKWEHVEVATVQSVRLGIALLPQQAGGDELPQQLQVWLHGEGLRHGGLHRAPGQGRPAVACHN